MVVVGVVVVVVVGVVVVVVVGVVVVGQMNCKWRCLFVITSFISHREIKWLMVTLLKHNCLYLISNFIYLYTSNVNCKILMLTWSIFSSQEQRSSTNEFQHSSAEFLEKCLLLAVGILAILIPLYGVEMASQNYDKRIEIPLHKHLHMYN